MVGNVSGMDLGTAVGRVVIDVSGVGAAISQAQRAFSSGLQNMGSSMQNFGSQVAGVGASLVGLTAPLLLAGKKGLEAAADFDTLLNQIKVFGGVAPDELDKVREYALKMGADTKFSASDAAASMLDLLKSGQSLEQAMAALPSVMNLAAAGEMSLAQAAGITSSGLAQFGLKAEDANRVANALARAANASRADVSDLGMAMQNVGPIAAQFGLSFEDTAAIMGVFSNNGIMGAEAGTQLKSMLLNLSRPTESVKGAFEQLGVSLYDSAGNTRNFNQVIKDLDGALDKLPIEQQNELMQTLAGSYGITGFAALRASGGIDTMLQSMAGAPDAGSVAEEFMNSFQGKIESLQGSIETFWIEGLTPFMNEALAPLVGQVTDVVNSLTQWAKENPKLTKTIASVVGAIAGLGGAMIAGGGALSAIGTIVSGVGSALGLLLSPLGLVVAGFAALAVAYETNFLGLRDTLQPILEQVAGGFETLFGVLGNLGNIINTEGIGTAIDSIINAFAQMLGFVGQDAMWEPLVGFSDRVIASFTQIANTITAIVQPALDSFFGGLATFWEMIQPGLQAFAGWFITDGLPSVVNIIQSVVIPAVSGFIQILSDIWNLAAPFLANLFNWFTVDALPAVVNFLNTTIIPGVQSFIDLLMGFWTSIQPGLNSFFLWVTQDALPLVSDFFTNVLQPVIGTFIDVLLTIWDVVSPALTTLFNWFMTDGLPFISQVIGFLMDNFLKPLINLLTGIWEAVKPGLEGFKTGIQGIFDWIISNVITPLQNAFQGVMDFINNVLVQLGVVQQQTSSLQQTTNDTLPVFNAGTYNIPGFAGGIDYIPHDMLAQVHTGEAVLTAEENRARPPGGGAGGGMTVGTINLNVPLEVLRDEPNLQQNAAKFAEAFMDEYRRLN